MKRSKRVRQSPDRFTPSTYDEDERQRRKKNNKKPEAYDNDGEELNEEQRRLQEEVERRRQRVEKRRKEEEESSQEEEGKRKKKSRASVNNKDKQQGDEDKLRKKEDKQRKEEKKPTKEEQKQPQEEQEKEQNEEGDKQRKGQKKQRKEDEGTRKKTNNKTRASGVKDEVQEKVEKRKEEEKQRSEGEKKRKIKEEKQRGGEEEKQRKEQKEKQRKEDEMKKEEKQRKEKDKQRKEEVEKQRKEEENQRMEDEKQRMEEEKPPKEEKVTRKTKEKKTKAPVVKDEGQQEIHKQQEEGEKKRNNEEKQRNEEEKQRKEAEEKQRKEEVVKQRKEEKEKQRKEEETQRKEDERKEEEKQRKKGEKQRKEEVEKQRKEEEEQKQRKEEVEKQRKEEEENKLKEEEKQRKEEKDGSREEKGTRKKKRKKKTKSRVPDEKDEKQEEVDEKGKEEEKQRKGEEDKQQNEKEERYRDEKGTGKKKKKKKKKSRASSVKDEGPGETEKQRKEEEKQRQEKEEKERKEEEEEPQKEEEKQWKDEEEKQHKEEERSRQEEGTRKKKKKKKKKSRASVNNKDKQQENEEKQRKDEEEKQRKDEEEKQRNEDKERSREEDRKKNDLNASSFTPTYVSGDDSDGSEKESEQKEKEAKYQRDVSGDDLDESEMESEQKDKNAEYQKDVSGDDLDGSENASDQKEKDAEFQKEKKGFKRKFDDDDIESEIESEESEERYPEDTKFTMIVPYTVWQSISPTEEAPRKLKSDWVDKFNDAFNEQVIPECALGFKRHFINSKEKCTYFNADGYCLDKTVSCGVFKFTIKEKPKEGEDVNVHINVDRRVLHHNPRTTRKRRLRGKRRAEYGEELKTKSASKLRQEKYGKTDEKQRHGGNQTKFQNAEVFRKLKEELASSEIIHKDQFTALVYIKRFLEAQDPDKRIKGYIQEVGYDPFLAILYKEESLLVARNNIKHRSGVFRIDATGSIVNDIFGKRVFYYAVIVDGQTTVERVKNPPCPVLEYLTDCHTTVNIMKPLMRFFADLKVVSKIYYIPKRFECDFSWAMIHAVCLSCNHCHISKYIETCHLILNGNGPDQLRITVIHLCANHIFKAFREQLYNITRDTKLRELGMRLFTLLLNCTSLRQSVAVWKIICTVLGHRYLNEEVEEAIKELTIMVKKADVGDVAELVCDEDWKMEFEGVEGEAHRGIRASSPFNALYRGFIPQEPEDEGQENEHFWMEFIKLIMEKYMPLSPLWSGMMLGDLERHKGGDNEEQEEETQTRDTNANVENWMKIIKKDTMPKRAKFRVDVFLGQTYEALNGRLLSYLDIDQLFGEKKRRKQKKTNTDDADEDFSAKEAWGAKRSKSGETKGKGRTSYYNTPTDEFPKRKTPKGKKADNPKKKGDPKDHQTPKGTTRSGTSTPKDKKDEQTPKGTKRSETSTSKDETKDEPTTKGTAKSGTSTSRDETKDKPTEKGTTKSGYKDRQDKQQTVRKPGIRNVGLTCWLISTVQALAALNEIYLEDDEDDVSIAVWDVVDDLKTSLDKSVSIDTLKMTVSKVLPQLKIGQNQDANEFLCHILCHLSDTKIKTIYKSTCRDCDKKNEIIEDLHFLHVEIPPIKHTSVQSCLAEFYKEEVMTGHNAIECKSCEFRTNHTRACYIESASEIFVMQLKRFRQVKNRFEKNNDEIIVNRLVSIGKQSDVYRLSAVQCHIGGALKNGHYVTFSYSLSGEVVKFDDLNVTLASHRDFGKDIIMEGSYLLYYERMQVFNPFLNKTEEPECKDESEFLNGLRGIPEDHILTYRGNFPLTYGNLKCLTPNASTEQEKKLNDQVVNVYFKLIESVSPNVASVDSLFCTAIMNKRDAKKYFKDHFLSKEKVLIPAVRDDHWVLLILYPKTHTLELFDSARISSPHWDNIRHFLDTKIIGIEPLTFKRIQGLPKQRNLIDCGVFMAQYAVSKALNKDINFTQNDMTHIRNAMTIELISGNIMPRC